MSIKLDKHKEGTSRTKDEYLVSFEEEKKMEEKISKGKLKIIFNFLDNCFFKFNRNDEVFKFKDNGSYFTVRQETVPGKYVFEDEEGNSLFYYYSKIHSDEENARSKGGHPVMSYNEAVESKVPCTGTGGRSQSLKSTEIDDIALASAVEDLDKFKNGEQEEPTEEKKDYFLPEGEAGSVAVWNGTEYVWTKNSSNPEESNHYIAALTQALDEMDRAYEIETSRLLQQLIDSGSGRLIFEEDNKGPKFDVSKIKGTK